MMQKIVCKHTTRLTCQCFYFILLFKLSVCSCFSLSELEDVLSCDDEVLNDVYQYHTPPLRRLPPLLWVRIQDDLDDYLVTSGADGIQVIRWYHRQFHTVASERYLSDEIKR